MKHNIFQSLLILSVFSLGVISFVGCDDSSTGSEQLIPPTCNIIAPWDGQSVTDTVEVIIEATDDFQIAYVQLLIDNDLRYSSGNPPHIYKWDTSVCPDSSYHTLWAEVTDVDSLKAVSDTVQVMVKLAEIVYKNLLLVANQAQGAGYLSMVTLETGRVNTAVAGLGRYPNDIVYRDDTLYVINSGSHQMNILRLNDDNSITQLEVIELNDYSPQYATIGDNGKMYISNFFNEMVTVFDIPRRQAISFVPVGKTPADVLAFDSKIYVCNSGYDVDTRSYDPGTVSVIATSTNLEETRIGVGMNPQFMALDENRRIHVVCTGDYADEQGEIWIIDPQTDEVVQIINIGGSPGDIVIIQDNTAYVAAAGLAGKPDVYTYNASTGQIYNGPDNPIVADDNAMRVVAASDSSVYVSCYNGNSVVKLQGSTRVDSYIVGEGPMPMVIVERE